MDERKKDVAAAAPPARPGPYAPPVLRVYGAMTALTATGTGPNAESKGMPAPTPTRKMA